MVRDTEKSLSQTNDINGYNKCDTNDLSYFYDSVYVEYLMANGLEKSYFQFLLLLRAVCVKY